MDDESAFDIGPWLKTDLISGFSDLLDDKISPAELQSSAATFDSADLGMDETAALCAELSSDQDSHTDWFKNFMSGVAPAQADKSPQPQTNGSQPFRGFPAAEPMPSVSVPIGGNATRPVSCNRMLESGQFGTPSSWESSLSSYSLESSLVDLPSAAEPPAERGNLKSENSFGCSFDSYDNSMALESSKENSTKACKPRAKDPPSNVKASLADRNRERQQRFRQRQKNKIETLEGQVVRLTAQTRAMQAEKEDLGGRAAKLTDLLQARDRALVNMTAQLSHLRNGAGGGAPGLLSDTPQLTLTYCNPPLVLTSSQIQKMDGLDLAKLWKEYVWQLDQLLPAGNCCRGQWTPTRERLDALTSELVQLMMHLWDCCQDFGHIKATGLIDETQRKAEETGIERWELIASQLTLDSEQMQCLNALRSSMSSRLHQVWAQRREAHANMYPCLEDALSSGREVAVHHLKMKQSTEILKEGLKQENLLARDFEFAFYKKVLTPDQRAICMTRAFPFFPDSQALANWIAAKHGDLAAQKLMTNYSSSSATSFHSNT